MSFAPAPFAATRLEMAPFRLSGVVYATLLNHRRSLDGLGAAVSEAPYRGAPGHVVLAVKPRGALVADGGVVALDGDVDTLEIGAALGLVIGMTACAVAEADALGHVAGFLAVADCTVPRPGHFRPQIRAMARDDSCVVGARVVARALGGDADALTMRTFVDGELVATSSTADHLRRAARLLAEVSEFMTLSPGDVLLTGSAPDGPRVRAGAHIAVEAGDWGRLEARVADARSGTSA